VRCGWLPPELIVFAVSEPVLRRPLDAIESIPISSSGDGIDAIVVCEGRHDSSSSSRVDSWRSVAPLHERPSWPCG
jgi:hypothetical protein